MNSWLANGKDLAGSWEETSRKAVLSKTEDIQFKLNKTANLIEGLGLTDGKITHNALAVISYDKQEKHYNFQSYMSNGMSGSFKAELIENKLH